MKVSQSKVKMWRQCKFAYHCKHVEKLRKKTKSRPLTFGTLVHEMLEAHANGDDPFDQLNKASVINAKLFDGGRQMLDLRSVVGQQPSLVIWGSDDAIIPVRHAQGLQAQVEVLPGQGHMVQLEAAEQVNKLLSLFLKSQA